MKILLLANFRTLPCGMAEFARAWAQALHAAGETIICWDSTDPISPVWDWADLVLLNWSPSTVRSDYQFPDRLPVVAWIHEPPPWALCPYWGRLQQRIVSVPNVPDTTYVPYPCVDYRSLVLPRLDAVVLGVSSVRKDGYAATRDLCQRRGWELNAPDGWLPIEREIDRLARSTVNVAWYDGTIGRASGVMTLLAAGRPIAISDSPMLHGVRGAAGITEGETIDAAVDRALDAPCPLTLRDQVSWSVILPNLLTTWRTLVCQTS